MQLIDDPEVMANWAKKRRRGGETVALVPTMGALHAGHLTLIKLARMHADEVVVSLFVNPIQFGEAKDFTHYPRKLEQDLMQCEALGVDVLFAPSADRVYMKDTSVWVDEELLSRGLCGESRPGHFRGVCTIVLKLLNLVQPDLAVFGEKDLQQLRIIERMVRDLNIPVEILRGKTVRESDGLAMSSRNQRLSEGARLDAVVIYESIQGAKKQVEQGERSVEVLIQAVRDRLVCLPRIVIDYVVVVDDVTLKPIERIHSTALLAIAVKLESIRLIDNDVLRRS
ncbi:MAG TPA: pantoate--beta-alanine ligase [Verrucomicrobia bacterium]|nr:pantoate--beta-alanine ligase [Verrucomicrobiota bacterium]